MYKCSLLEQDFFFVILEDKCLMTVLFVNLRMIVSLSFSIVSFSDIRIMLYSTFKKNLNKVSFPLSIFFIS